MYSKTQAKKDSVRTPPYILKWVKKKFGKYYDPTPFRPNFDISKDKNALTSNWKSGTVFVNPPFSQAKKFVEKAFTEYKLGDKTVILLVKTTVLGSTYFEKVPGCEIVFFPKAVIFPPHKATPRFHVCLLIYHKGRRSTRYSFFKNTT